MSTVISKDGTSIDIEESGQGPAIILVSGGSVDRNSLAALAGQLSPHFTVYNYDRRGRGKSGDTQPYAVEREVEDIEAVADHAGGTAYLFGSSSGAALALEAARLLPGKITKLVMWEPPFMTEGFPKPPADTAKVFHDFVANGDRGAAADYFMGTVVGLPPEFVAQAHESPWWPAQLALAHTLEYDATVMGDYSIPADRVHQVTIPTLVADGSASFPFLHPTALELAKLFPNAQQKTIEGQSHDFSAEVVAPVIVEFLKG